MTTETISDIFVDRLDKMEKKARAKGLNLTIICKELGVSRATPDRWKKETPKTIELLQRMEEFVDKAEDKPAPAAAVAQ